jgi:type IV secretory pathway VirD2 relaxase
LHPVVRAVDVVISRDYISHGLRSRAADLVSAELRSKPQHEFGSALAREVEAERWTRLDAAIRMAADDSASSTCGWTIRGVDDPQARRLAVGRLQKLERMGLATAAGPAQ